MKINVIGVPIFWGSDRAGVDYGPDKLREVEVVNVIKKNNHTVYDLGNIHVPGVSIEDKYASHESMKYLDPIVEVNTNLAHQVYNAVVAGNFPFVVGGDHSLGLGSIAGTSKHYDDLAVIWVDAHGDINTHETSPTGNVHGMPLAASMGLGHSKLTDLYYEGRKISPENVYIIGARDLDEGELQLIDELKLNVWTTKDVQELGIEKIMEDLHNMLKEKSTDHVHLSFDIDCLDSELVPGTGTPVHDGMTVAEAKYLLKYLMETKIVKSMDFVELNTMLDKDETTAKIAIDLIDWTFRYLE